MIVYLDGAFMPEQGAAISIHDPGFLAGDGVFETALLFDGGFFRLATHLARFAASAATMHIPAPDTSDLDRIVRAVARQNNLRSANIRITLTRGALRPLLLVTAYPPDEARIARGRLGWSVITARTRRPSSAAIPAQLKSLGRTYAILARLEARAAGADDALLLTDDGFVCEGPTWNVMWRVGDTVFTPALDAGVLAGVTRTVLLDLAARAGFQVREGAFSRASLDQADEIFATMTSVGIVHIHTLDDRSLPTHTPAADALRTAYMEVLATECARDPL